MIATFIGIIGAAASAVAYFHDASGDAWFWIGNATMVLGAIVNALEVFCHSRK